MDAFLSYASKDSPAADEVERALRTDGLQVWRDVGAIGVGQLLRTELRKAIRRSRCVTLLWSKAAARSRWVAAEIMTAFHMDRFIVPVALDRKPLPQFLSASVHLDFGRKEAALAALPRAVRQAPRRANPLTPPMRSESPELRSIIRELNRAQHKELDFLGRRDLERARQAHDELDPVLKQARKTYRYDSTILALAAYHAKNAYMEKHWDAIQAGRSPKDKLLAQAEARFFETLFVNPRNYSGLDGLGSVLMLERELEAAAFYFEKAIALAAQDGVDYAEAKQNLATVNYFLAAAGRR